MKKSTSLVLFTVFVISALATGIAEARTRNNVRPYGNLFMFLGYRDRITFDAADEMSHDSDMIYKINENSNFGMNFLYRNYTGTFEFGIEDTDENRRVKIRQAYGTAKLKKGKLTVGQAWNPYVKWSHEYANYFRSDGFGALNDGPSNQIKYSYKGFYIDIMKPYIPIRTYIDDIPAANPDASDPTNDEYIIDYIDRESTTKQKLEDVDSIIPKVAIGYDHNGKTFDWSIGIAGNAYQVKNDNYDEIIDSYLGYIQFEKKWKRVIMDFSGAFLINPTNYGISVQGEDMGDYTAGAACAVLNIATGRYEVKDTWSTQGYLEFAFLFKKITMFLGGGFSLIDYGIPNTDQDMAWEAYINFKIPVGNLVALSPSASYRDYMKDMGGNKEGSEILAGILCMVSFY